MSEQQAVLSKPRDLDSREGGAASGISTSTASPRPCSRPGLVRR